MLFSKLTRCFWQVTLFCMKCLLKSRALLRKDMLEIRWAAVNSYWWYMGKIILYWKIIISHNPKYYFKSSKRNKVYLSDIREFWKNKKYSEENIVSIHWQILQLLILAVPVRQVNQKKQFYWGRRTYCLFSLCCVVQFC